MSNRPAYHQLKLKDFVLYLNVGCGEEERGQPQQIRIHVSLRLQKMPEGARTDHLEGTLCYGELAHQISQHCVHKQFRLIERIGFEIYELTKSFCQEQALVSIQIQKVHPPVAGLTGGAWYQCGDFFE